MPADGDAEAWCDDDIGGASDSDGGIDNGMVIVAALPVQQWREPQTMTWDWHAAPFPNRRIRSASKHEEHGNTERAAFVCWTKLATRENAIRTRSLTLGTGSTRV